MVTRDDVMKFEYYAILFPSGFRGMGASGKPEVFRNKATAYFRAAQYNSYRKDPKEQCRVVTLEAIVTGVDKVTPATVRNSGYAITEQLKSQFPEAWNT